MEIEEVGLAHVRLRYNEENTKNCPKHYTLDPNPDPNPLRRTHGTLLRKSPTFFFLLNWSAN